MSPQPKWRVSAERLIAILERMPPEGTVMEYGVAEAWRAFLDLRDARAEIDTLQAAVRELRAALVWTMAHHKDALAGRSHAAQESIAHAEHVLARADKLLPEDK